MIIFLALAVFITRLFTNLYTFEYDARLILPALLSALTVVIIYLLSNKIFHKQDIGLIAGFLFFVSPWQHALEYRSISGILFVLLIIVTAYSFLRKQKLLGIVFGILAVIVVGYIAIQYQSVGEIFHEQQKTVWRQIVTDGSLQSVTVTRLLHNKVFELLWFTLLRLSTYYEPQGFFITGSYFIGTTIIGSGFLLTATLPFFLFGLVHIIQKKQNTFLLWWIVLGSIPGIVSIHVQHMVLGSMLLPALMLITALGIYDWCRASPAKASIVFFVLCINFVFVFSQYLPLL